VRYDLQQHVNAIHALCVSARACVNVSGKLHVCASAGCACVHLLLGVCALTCMFPPTYLKQPLIQLAG
jgi:hypothetical protein